MLERLWSLTVNTLLNKIESGDYTSQDLNIARQMLKDHSVTVAEVEESPLGDIKDILPFSTKRQTNEDDYLSSLPSSLSGKESH